MNRKCSIYLEFIRLQKLYRNMHNICVLCISTLLTLIDWWLNELQWDWVKVNFESFFLQSIWDGYVDALRTFSAVSESRGLKEHSRSAVHLVPSAVCQIILSSLTRTDVKPSISSPWTSFFSSCLFVWASTVFIICPEQHAKKERQKERKCSVRLTALLLI